MKFLLIITMCSSIYKSCMPPVDVAPLYNSHYECAYAGYTMSADIIKNLKEEQVNKDRIYISFVCKEVGSL